MADKIEPKRPLDDQGILAVSVETATQATEKTLLAGFGIVRDVKAEVAQRALGVIDWVEGTQQGLVRLARSFVQRTARDRARRSLDGSWRHVLRVAHRGEFDEHAARSRRAGLSRQAKAS